MVTLFEIVHGSSTLLRFIPHFVVVFDEFVEAVTVGLSRSRAHDRWWSSGMCAPRAAVSADREKGGFTRTRTHKHTRTHTDAIRRVDRRVPCRAQEQLDILIRGDNKNEF